MKVIIACEFSGVVRRAFVERGHTAWSVDILPSEMPCEYGGEDHIQDDIFDFLAQMHADYHMFPDLMIAFPPCTHLAASGARWWRYKKIEQRMAIEFVRRLMLEGIPRIAIENPVGILSTVIRPPEQIVQPWMFGDPEWKTTCLWLKNLPALRTINLELAPKDPGGGKRPGRHSSRIHRMSPGPDLAKNRSRTFPGIARAMAEQWGSL
jgi:site-specific DNA-cytosine methylase